MANEEGHGQRARHPRSRQDPRHGVHHAEEESLQGEHKVDVEEDGPEAEGGHVAVDEGEEELLVDVEPVEDVDGARVLSDVVPLQVGHPLGEALGLDELFEVGVVETGLGAEADLTFHFLGSREETLLAEAKIESMLKILEATFASNRDLK